MPAWLAASAYWILIMLFDETSCFLVLRSTSLRALFDKLQPTIYRRGKTETKLKRWVIFQHTAAGGGRRWPASSESATIFLARSVFAQGYGV